MPKKATKTKANRKLFLTDLVHERIKNPPDEDEDLRTWFYNISPRLKRWAEEHGISIENYNATHKQSFGRACYKDLSAVVSEMVLSHQTTYRHLRLLEEERKMEETVVPDFDFELWFEKVGMLKTLKPIRYGVRLSLVSCKGYQSTNVLSGSKNRFDMSEVKRVFVISDHDPSGQDLADDLQRRADRLGYDVNFKRIGVDPADVPDAKKEIELWEINWKDSRAKKFVEKWGEDVYEVSALNNKELRALVVAKMKAEGVNLEGLPEKRLEENQRKHARQMADSLLDDLRQRLINYCLAKVEEYDERELSVGDLEVAMVQNLNPLPDREMWPLLRKVKAEARIEFDLEEE